MINSKFKLFILALFVHSQSTQAVTENEADSIRIRYSSIIDSVLNKPYPGTKGPLDKAYKAFEKNDFRKAIDYYNSYLSSDPENKDALFSRGVCYYKIQDNHCCRDFRYSGYLGHKSALNNYKALCDSSIDDNVFLEGGLIYSNSSDQAENKIDSAPEFPGGLDSMYVFIINNLGSDFFRNYDFNSRVIVKFNVSSEGKISDPDLINTDTYKENIEGVIKEMPKWIPAMQNGKPVSCYYLFPIIYGEAFQRERNQSYNHGIELLNENKLNDAIACFNTAIIFNESDHEALFNRGIALHNLNNDGAACKDLNLSFIINPDKKITELINKHCNGQININGELFDISSNADAFGKIYTMVETMPEFTGGQEKLFEYLRTNIKYPAQAREENISGRVYATFVVDLDGKIRQVKIVRGIGGGCDEETLRVVKKMPDWIPGRQNGLPVKVQYNLPLNFNLR